MTTQRNPLAAWAPNTPDTFDPKHYDDVVAMARHLVDGNHPGVLTTVDEEGRPHTRWMATVALDDFPRVYTLTAPGSFKLANIAKNPFVDWMFSNRDLTFILNFSGRAEALSDTASIKRIWKTIEDKSHAYFLHGFNEKPGFAILQTTVEKVSWCIPQSNIRRSLDIESLRGA